MKIEQVAVEGAVLTVYLRQPAEAMPLAATRPLVLVVPGGGYEHVSAREADPVAVRFLAAGYHAAVLEYGVGEQARDYRPFRQIDGALALLRERAAEWGIRPDKIAACGFSAGGAPGPGLGGAAPARPDVLGRAAAPQRPDPVLSGGDGGALCPPGQLRGPERRP